MPHSSGGGSHGGGSHGGSHHSSHRSSSRSGSSTPARRASSTAFAGATRYVYYRNKQPVFVYSNYDIRGKRKSSITTLILTLIFLVVPSMAILAGMIFLSGHFPKPLTMNYDTQIYIDDQIGIVKDPNGLMKSLTAFQQKTGITPAVLICPNDAWQDNYSSLEDYAYDEYVNRFSDEKHWLIVYTTSVTASGFDDWHWEGMQGDDTDPILDDKQTKLFTDNLHKYLLQSKQYSVDQAIAQAFNDLTPGVMRKYLNWPLAGCLTGIEVVFVGMCILACDPHPVRDKYYQKAEVCDPKFVDQEECEYCGGIYIVGMHLACPYCGAPVKPHDYMTDENGNITQMMN